MSKALVSGNIISKRLVEARHNANMSQVELAACMCVDHNITMTRETISSIEVGRRKVSDKEIRALCAILGVSPNWLLEHKE